MKVKKVVDREEEVKGLRAKKFVSASTPTKEVFVSLLERFNDRLVNNPYPADVFVSQKGRACFNAWKCAVEDDIKDLKKCMQKFRDEVFKTDTGYGDLCLSLAEFDELYNLYLGSVVRGKQT